MRKNQLKLIKKTERWLHRKKGIDSINIPKDIDDGKITRFVILGSCDGEADGTLHGCGDRDADSGLYSIGLRSHGKNIIGGDEFVAIHQEKKICTVSKPAITEEKYLFIPDEDSGGIPLIDKSIFKFKEKTAYTLAFTVTYITATRPRDLKLTFNYTDGSSYTPVYETIKKTITDCIVTDPEKTLDYISSSVGDRIATGFIIADFGLYEGAYTVHSDVHEAYVGDKITLMLDSPLYSIGYASDELDLISGRLTRKIEKLRVDASAALAKTDRDGVFEIALARPMRRGGKIVSPFGELCEDSECGISSNEDGSAILFKPPGEFTEPSDVKEYLLDGAFDVFYVLETPKQESLNIDIPSLFGTSSVDVLTESSPRKCFVEYY